MSRSLVNGARDVKKSVRKAIGEVDNSASSRSGSRRGGGGGGGGGGFASLGSGGSKGKNGFVSRIVNRIGSWFDADAWLSKNPSKRHTEKTFLWLSLAWVACFALIVTLQVYKMFGDVAYMSLGLAVALPFVIVPIYYPGDADRNTPILQRYFVKANVWIFFFGFVGNYFWTHYFYKILGASYSFPVTIMLNEVPVFLYLVTHAYFCSYHTFSTILLRRFWRSFNPSSRIVQYIGSALVIVLMAVITAFMETYTISAVPYYSHKNKYLMYTVGSVFYAIYFIVSFPMFYRVDEKPGEKWDLGRVAVDSLGAAMLVFILLDFWRLTLPAIGASTSSWRGIPYFETSRWGW